MYLSYSKITHPQSLPHSLTLSPRSHWSESLSLSDSLTAHHFPDDLYKVLTFGRRFKGPGPSELKHEEMSGKEKVAAILFYTSLMVACGCIVWGLFLATGLRNMLQRINNIVINSPRLNYQSSTVCSPNDHHGTYLNHNGKESSPKDSANLESDSKINNYGTPDDDNHNDLDLESSYISNDGLVMSNHKTHGQHGKPVQSLTSVPEKDILRVNNKILNNRLSNSNNTVNQTNCSQSNSGSDSDVIQGLKFFTGGAVWLWITVETAARWLL